MNKLSKGAPSRMLPHLTLGPMLKATLGAGTRAMQRTRVSISPPAVGVAYTEIKNKGGVYLLARQNKPTGSLHSHSTSLPH